MSEMISGQQAYEQLLGRLDQQSMQISAISSMVGFIMGVLDKTRSFTLDNAELHIEHWEPLLQELEKTNAKERELAKVFRDEFDRMMARQPPTFRPIILKGGRAED